jgi:hypothetical protein
MRAIISNYGVQRGIKLTSRNAGTAIVDDAFSPKILDSLPLYMAFLL